MLHTYLFGMNDQTARLGAIKLVNPMTDVDDVVDVVVEFDEAVAPVVLPSTGMFAVNIEAEKVQVTAIKDRTSLGATLTIDRSVYGTTRAPHIAGTELKAVGESLVTALLGVLTGASLLEGTLLNLLSGVPDAGGGFAATASVSPDMNVNIGIGVAVVGDVFVYNDLPKAVLLNWDGMDGTTNRYRKALVCIDVAGNLCVAYGATSASSPAPDVTVPAGTTKLVTVAQDYTDQTIAGGDLTDERGIV